MANLDIEQATRLILQLQGIDLHKVASEHGITVLNSDGKINKGWAGLAIERHLGMAANCVQEPDFGDWELKVVPVRKLGSGQLKVKETMAITMINPKQVKETTFENSHLLSKLRKLLLVARVVGNHAMDPTYIQSAAAFNLSGQTYETVKADYESVQRTIIESGFDSLTGRMGKLVQPRTKGQANTNTRAFYARTGFLESLLTA